MGGEPSDFSLLLFSQILKMLSGSDVPPDGSGDSASRGVTGGRTALHSRAESSPNADVFASTRTRVLSAFYSQQTQHCKDIKKDSCGWDQAVTLTDSSR